MEIGITLTGLAFTGGILLVALFILAVRYLHSPEKVIRRYTGSDERTNVFVKKYREADIEFYRGAAMRFGLLIVLVFLIMAFNLSRNEPVSGMTFAVADEEIIEQDIPVTQQIKPPPPPPPPPPPQIEVVEDDEILEEEPVIEASEVELDEAVVVEEVVEVEVEVVAEEPEPEPEEPDVFSIVEEMPTYPGGQQELLAYLASNIKYPLIAVENGVEGTVVLRFVIDATGSISDIRIARDIGAGCGREAVRVAKTMPKWNPGRQRGMAVPVYFTMPVRFKLD